jgi:endogenous inhibitor of DNA gyrase (YacG/DUF329 family)
MIDSVECPRCKADIYIDDPIAEDDAYETECGECGKAVVISVTHTVSHSAVCASTEHAFQPMVGQTGWVECSMCGVVRRDSATQQ